MTFLVTIELAFCFSIHCFMSSLFQSPLSSVSAFTFIILYHANFQPPLCAFLVFAFCGFKACIFFSLHSVQVLFFYSLVIYHTLFQDTIMISFCSCIHWFYLMHFLSHHYAQFLLLHSLMLYHNLFSTVCPVAPSSLLIWKLYLFKRGKFECAKCI